MEPVMTRNVRRLVALALLGGLLTGTVGRAHAQAAASGQPAAAAPTGEPEILKTLPRPPDQPASLLAPAPPHPPFAPYAEKPYFVPDPLLDPPCWPPPGCFAGAEVDILDPHVKNKLTNQVTIGTNAPDTVALPGAALDWTVSPRFRVGYRLPAGFGEVSLGYRFLTSEGSESVLGPDGPAVLKSRLDLNQIDLDYASRELSLWPHCQMKWHIGLRLVYLYFDSRQDEPFNLAAPGSAVFEQRESDSYVGFGPHAGLELWHHLCGIPCARWLDSWGLSLYGRADVGMLLGRLRQGFFETSTTIGPDGFPLTGETRVSSSQSLPMVSVQAGVRWEPYRDLHVFLGYTAEYWWHVGTLSNLDSRGDLIDQGLVLQAELSF
jgi:hypothetical protein